MIPIIACGQSDVLGDGCPGCGGWLHCEVRGGFAGPKGWRFCSEDCAAGQEEWLAQKHVADHVGTRDLLCDCAEFCAPRGLPTAEMRQEYADYLASIKGTALDPAVGRG